MQMQSFTVLPPPCRTSLFCFAAKHCCCLVKINCRWRKNIKIALSASTLQLLGATTATTTIVATVAANGSKEVSLIVCKINTMLARAAPALPGVEGRVVGSPRTKEKHFSNVLPPFAWLLLCQCWLPGNLSNGVTITKKAHVSYTRFRVTMWDKFL